MENVRLFGMMRLSFVLVLVFMVGGVVGAEYVPGELVVRYEDSDVATESFSVASLEMKDVGDDGLVVLSFDEDEDMVELAEVYSELDGVLYAEPNYIYHAFVSMNDLYYSTQWYLEDVSVDDAWNLTLGNESVVVAVIDTGVDWGHEDLADKIWNNSNEVAGNGLDDDGNGYVDDVRGWDFVNFTSSEASYYCYAEEDCVTEDNDPEDVQGHGTHCAGIIGAEANNSVGVAGVCPNCEVMALRSGFKDSSGDGSFTTLDLVEAIGYAVDNNASIISMSWGGTSDSQALEDALQAAYDAGVILVAAAGNDGVATMNYPAAYDFVIAVGSTDSLDEKSSFSNYGSWVDIAAPGSNISSTYLADSYVYMSGTSMATPLVAGVVGLMKSVFGDLNQSEILSALVDTGSNVAGYDMKRIDVYAALLSVDDAPNVTLVSPGDGAVNLSVNQSFVCNVSDLRLSNLTFRIWNSSGEVYYNESVNVSGVENSSVFNVTDMGLGEYVWNCFGVDSLGNGAWGSSNFSLTIGSIEVNLNSPGNGSYTNVNYSEFNCSVRSDVNYSLSNLSFFLWDSNDTLLKNESVNVSGFSNSSVFNWTFLSDDSYVWECVGVNNNSDEGDGVNYTVTYDSVAPVISSVSSGDPSTSAATISWTTNESCNSSLWVSGGSWSNSSSLVTSHSVAVSGLSSGSSYSYVVFSCDKSSNCVNSSGSFSTDSESSGGGGGGSSGSSSGGGGGSSSSSGPTVYSVSASQLSVGYTKSLRIGNRIEFDLSGEEHSVSISRISDGVVSLLVQSEPVYVKLSAGESVKLNLGSVDYYDLEVEVVSVSGSNAVVVITAINEVIEREEVVEEVEEKVVEDSGYDAWMFYWIVVGLVAVWAVRILVEDSEKGKKIKKKKSRKRRDKR